MARRRITTIRNTEYGTTVRFHTFAIEPTPTDEPISWTITAKLFKVAGAPITVAEYRTEQEAKAVAEKLNHGGEWKQSGNVFTDDDTPQQRSAHHARDRRLTGH